MLSQRQINKAFRKIELSALRVLVVFGGRLFSPFYEVKGSIELVLSVAEHGESHQ